MTTWTFEPGHTAAEFCARHMMVINVRGHFKNVHGKLKFGNMVEITIDAEAILEGS